jgi:tetratricopeptide (TPR) repeat protein
MGNTTRQIEIYEQSLATARRAGDRQSIGSNLSALGSLYSQQGNMHKGITYLEEALQIKQSLGDRIGAMLVCKNLAGCYELGLHDLSTAIQYLEMASNLAVDKSDQEAYASMAARRREELNKKSLRR